MSQLDDAALNEAFADLGLIEAPAEVAPAEPVEASVVEGTPTEPQTEQPEAPAEGQPRDDQGRFVAKQEEQPPEEQSLILGRFKTHEELERAYQALDSEFGRRNQEWGDVRKELEELRGTITQSQQPQQQGVQLTQEAVDWFDDQVQQNPYGAVEWARQNDPSGALVQRGLDAWYELAPRHAAAYERQFEIAALRQEFGQSQKPLQEEAFQQGMNRAFVNFANSEAPDAVNYAEAMLAEATANPELLSPLQSGTHEDQMRVFRNLYRLAKAGGAITQSDAQAQATAQVDAEAEAARAAAFVASGSQTQEPDVRSAEERWLEEVFDPAAAQFYG